MDDRLLAWARLPGPRKVLAAARRRLEAGHSLNGSPLRADLTPGERAEVGRLLASAGSGRDEQSARKRSLRRLSSMA